MPVRLAAFLLLMSSLPWGHANERVAEPVSWICWLGAGSEPQIHCVREDDSILPAAEQPATLFDDARARAQFLQAGKPRNVTRVVRDSGGAYDRVLWSIPLYSVPFNMEDVRLLAASIMCGTSPACTLTLSDAADPVVAQSTPSARSGHSAPRR